ncbi:MAG: HNH endonuclease [Oligoflexia bacterium]|nr:HNH endonuclease [Oligoflexia bacterium]
MQSNILENTLQMQIHNKALEAANSFKKAEASLIDILQKVDEYRVYQDFDCKSLYEYCVKILKLSESVAYNFITVARKAKEVPQLREAIQNGDLSVSKARKITPILTPANQDQWLQMAQTLPQKKLEQEVAKSFPKEAVPERLKFITELRLSLTLGVSHELSEKLKQVQDLEAQRRQKSVTLEETLEALVDIYLKAKSQPVARQVSLAKKPLSITRQVDLRDNGQCSFVDQKGIRCSEKRWLHVHHMTPRSRGGDDSLENLATLCSGHHRLVHTHHT